MNKTRSRSEELDSNLLTNEFTLRAAEESLSQSMRQSSSRLQEADEFIKAKERDLARLREEKR